MGESLSELIAKALAAARTQTQSRENSLVITKLQEALMWHHMHEQELQNAARRAGFHISQEQQSGTTPP